MHERSHECSFSVSNACLNFLSRFTALVLLALQRFNLFFEFPSFQAILASSSYSKAFETFSLRVHNFVDIRKKNKCV